MLEPRFAFPLALALLALVPWTIWVGWRIQSLSGGRKATAVTLRVIILLCLVFALAGMELVRTNDHLAVFFLLDHSNSVSETQRLQAAQAVRNMAEQYMDTNKEDKAGVIVFGEEASIELTADETLGLRDILSYVGGEQTDLAAGIRLAMAAFPQGHMKRMVVFSDGNETRGAALEEAKLARAAGAAIEVVPLRTGDPEEVRIHEVSAPNQAKGDEPFQLRIVAEADQDTTATLRVMRRRDDERQLLPPQEVTLQQGVNTFVLTQELTGSGFYEYEVSIDAESDTVLANNQGRTFTYVRGEPSVLLVAAVPEEAAYLAPALQAEGLSVRMANPGTLPTSLAQFQNYDAVVLADVSSTDLASEQMATLEAMVRDLGIGLVMVGGPDSFGAGGYLDSPVERALPVDMDIKQRKVLPRGALALVLHTMEFADGNAWAREISLAATNVLASQDLIGLLGYMYNGGDTWIHELAPKGDGQAVRDAIRVGSTQIGDMPSVDPTLRLAYNALSSADAAVKRIVVISDGDPAPPSIGAKTALRNAGIAVSTVCINPHSPSDQLMLRELAEDTGGQFYYVTNPNNLPQIFTKEAAVVKRGLMIEEPFTPQLNHDSELLYGVSETMPELRGYVVTTAKDSATVPLLTHEGDPLLAHWRYGLGKSVAFTSDASSRWGADWLGWEGFNRFWAQSVRWATRELTPSNFNVSTRVEDGRGHIRIDAVDEEGRFINYLRPRGVVTAPGPDFERSELELAQTGPGIYEVSFPLSDSGVYMANILYTNPDGTQGMLPVGLALNYSPEYAYSTANIPLLEEVAHTAGGALRDVDYNPFTHDLKASPAVTPVWPWLVAIAACLFPVEIFVRRVVVPLHVITDPLRKAVRALPGLGKLVPAPKRRPQAVTGAYSARTAATERAFAAADGAPAFGQMAAPPTGQDANGAGEAATEQPAEKPAARESAYTQQLLAAKERAIAKKSRRLGDE